MAARKMGRVPTQAERARIKAYLMLGVGDPMPRCRHRDSKRVRAFEAEGDFSHSGRGHLCDECRCNRTAGYRSSIDIYDDIVGVGHYGVGFCYFHETRKSDKVIMDMARRQVRALHSIGRKAADMDTMTDLVAQVVACQPLVELARDQQVREARSAVHGELRRMLHILQGGTKQPDEVLEELHRLRVAIENNSGIAAGTAQDLKRHIDGIIFSEGGLTEKGGQGQIRMTDATRLSLVAKLGKTLSSMGLDDFRMTEKDYMEKRIVATKLAQSMNETGKLLAEEFGDEVADRIKRKMAEDVFIPVWGDI